MFQQVTTLDAHFDFDPLSYRGKSLAGSKPASSSLKEDRKHDKDKTKSGSGSRGGSGTSSSKHKPSPAKVNISRFDSFGRSFV